MADKQTDAAVGLVVLAGGQARRMGGANKALQMLDGKPLLAHVLGRLAPHAAATVVSANRDLPQTAAFGYPVVRDWAVYADMGPLAGMVSAAFRLPEMIEYIQVVPCDMPYLDWKTVLSLHRALLHRPQNDIVFAEAGGTAFPVVCQFRRRHLANIETVLQAAGSHSVRSAILPFAHECVAFGDERQFQNCNTREDLQRLQSGVPPL